MLELKCVILKNLETIQNQELRGPSGACRTSSIVSIFAEINYIPSTRRRNIQISTHSGKLLAQREHLNSYSVCSFIPLVDLGNITGQHLQTYNSTSEQLTQKLALKFQKRIIQQAVPHALQHRWTTDPHTYLLRPIRPE